MRRHHNAASAQPGSLNMQRFGFVTAAVVLLVVVIGVIAARS